MNDIIFCTEDGFAVETLYLKSLPKDIRGDHLFDYFSTFGNLQSVRIHTQSTGSFGFVKFQKAEAAAKALKMKYHTIDGRNIHVDIARKWHQDEPTTNEDTPIEWTNVTGTQLMDLNDDCLREILIHVTHKDLNSLVELSDATKNNRLKSIANEIFQRKYTIYCQGNDKWDDVRRTVTNFGPLISHFSFEGTAPQDHDHIETIARYCGGTLKSLRLQVYLFDDAVVTMAMRSMFGYLEKLNLHLCFIIRDNAADSLSYCKSLVELRISDIFLWPRPPYAPYTSECRSVLRHTFPKLESFIGEVDTEIFKDFIPRHKKLKTIKLSKRDDQTALLPIIADNCSELKNLHISTYGNGNPINYENSVKAITNLTHLEVLTIKSDPDPLLFIRQLNFLHSLKELNFWNVRGSTEILEAISQLKWLEKLHFYRCEGFVDLNSLAELVRLKDLYLSFLGNVNFDVVYMVRRLTHMEKLNLNFYDMDFKMDEEMDLRIMNSPPKSDNHRPKLEITCGRETRTYFSS